MILRRRPARPEPPWRPRVVEARAILDRHVRDPETVRRLDALETALARSVDDDTALADAVEQLGGDRVATELKQALRSRPDPTAPDSPQITALRRRYESVRELQNARDDLVDRVATSVADLEAYAAAVVAASFRQARHDEPAELLQALRDHATALAQAHDELDRLAPDPPGPDRTRSRW